MHSLKSGPAAAAVCLVLLSPATVFAQMRHTSAPLISTNISWPSSHSLDRERWRTPKGQCLHRPKGLPRHCRPDHP